MQIEREVWSNAVPRAHEHEVVVVLLAGLAAALALAPAAVAQSCDDPGAPGCEPYTIEHTNSITVNAPSSGAVTGDGIACPGDCSQSYDWSEICIPGPRVDECSGEPPLITLTGV